MENTVCGVEAGWERTARERKGNLDKKCARDGKETMKIDWWEGKGSEVEVKRRCLLAEQLKLVVSGRSTSAVEFFV
jgi:hypothetical protein